MLMVANSWTSLWALAQCMAGHLNPIVVEEIQSALRTGMLFVTPSPISTDAAERICKRFGIDQVRFYQLRHRVNNVRGSRCTLCYGEDGHPQS